MCPQTLKDDNIIISDGQSEDCQYIKIFSPDINTKNKYPAFVLIPGGGFIGGNEIPSNRSIYGQTTALKFLENYISEFGVDPERITLADHSTGAASVDAQSISLLSRNLFQQLIIMSGQVNVEFSGTIPLLKKDIDYNIASDLCNITKYEWNNYPMDSVNDYFIGFLPDTLSNLYKIVPIKPIILGSVNDEAGRGGLEFHNFIALDTIRLMNKRNNNVYLYENSYAYNYCAKTIINALSHADDFFALTMRPEFFDSPNTSPSTITINSIITLKKLGSLNFIAVGGDELTNDLAILNIDGVYNSLWILEGPQKSPLNGVLYLYLFLGFLSELKYSNNISDQNKIAIVLDN
uniref:COesterase domain-containing protein n=1 Tax=Strongyloides venezuelensis TaxID=75913 RepID=A0A0K0EYA6_STRVS